jgi:membrane protein YqaA with SNARE-associated domain
MLRRLYDWTMAQAAHAKAPQALFWVSFIESSVFPIPPDVMLIPMVLAKRVKAWFYATVATVGSVLGGIAGYAIGFLLLEMVGYTILRFYGFADRYAELAEQFNAWGVWIVLVGGATPFPYKVTTILAGATHMNIVLFVLASIVARGLRFFVVAGLLYWFGPPVRAFIERRFNLLSIVFVVLLIGGFIATRYLF